MKTLGRSLSMHKLGEIRSKIVEHMVAFGFKDIFTSLQGISPVAPVNATGFQRHLGGDGWQVQDGMLHAMTSETIGTGTSFPYGELGMWYEPGILRERGVAIVVEFIPEDRASQLFVGLSRHSGLATYDELDNHWVNVHGGLYFTANEQVVEFISNFREIKPMLYVVAVILRASGAYYLISTFENDSARLHGEVDVIGIPQYPNFRVLGVDRRNISPLLYSNIQMSDGFGYPTGHTIRSVQVKKLDSLWEDPNGITIFRDTFDRVNGPVGNGWTIDSGDWQIVNNELALVNPDGFNRLYKNGVADGILCATVKIPEGGTIPWFGLYARRKDSGNYLRLINDGQNAIKLQVFVNGGYGDTIFGAPYTWSPGEHDIAFYMYGNAYALVINGNTVVAGWLSDSQNRMIDGTGHGFYMLDNGVRATFKDIFFIPHTVELPVSVVPHGIKQFTGSTIFNDTFAYSDGTPLAQHGWIDRNGTATVQGQRAVLSGSGQLFVTRDCESLEYEVSTDFIIAPTTTDYVAAGIVINYVDQDNLFVVRPTIDKFDQPDADEIEIYWAFNGEYVVRKVQMNGSVYIPNATHRLTVRCINDPMKPNLALVYVLLDGQPKLTFSIPAAMQRTSVVGLYRNSMDDGTTFDNFEIKV